jgi:ABC-type Fe3+ transport system substrate-binding protein
MTTDQKARSKSPLAQKTTGRREFLKTCSFFGLAMLGRDWHNAGPEYDALYAIARKEGQLNLYGGGPASWYTDWTKNFTTRFPGIQVVFKGGFSNQLTPLIDGQLAARKMEADVAVLQTLQDFARWKRKGVLQPLKDTVFDHMPAKYHDPQGCYTGVSVYTLSYAYNRAALGASPPRSAMDFLQTEFKGKLISVYPQTDDVTLYLFWTIVDRYGWSFMKAYMANKPAFVKGHLGVAQAIDTGQYGASFDTITELSATQPGYRSKSGVLFSKIDPAPYWPQTAGIFRNCPHPAAARLFLEWTLGYAQQQRMSRNGVWPVRSDVPPPTGFNPLEKMLLADGYSAFINQKPDELAALRKKFNGYIGDPVGVDIR